MEKKSDLFVKPSIIPQSYIKQWKVAIDQNANNTEHLSSVILYWSGDSSGRLDKYGGLIFLKNVFAAEDLVLVRYSPGPRVSHLYNGLLFDLKSIPVSSSQAPAVLS